MFEPITSKKAEAGVNDLLLRLRKGIWFGFVIACFYSLYAVGLYLLRGTQPFEAHGITLGTTLAAYYVGGIVAGGIIGALLPLTRFRIGAMFIYSLAAFFVFLSIAVAADGVRNIDWIGCVILATVFGVIGSFVWRHLLS